MTKYQKILLGTVTAIFIWSAINPHDYFTWFLEVVPAIMGFILLAATYKNFRFSNVTYTLIALHAVILMVGGHSTYAEVPLFNWLRDIGIFERNNYDKIGHLAQGFIPAIVAREILLRTSPLKPGKWLNFIVVSITGLITALYEIIEWLVAVAVGSAGDAFLGTQGYIWDTQSDMALCLLGAILALVLLTKFHNKQLQKIGVLPQ
jgi:putative membrane protein